MNVYREAFANIKKFPRDFWVVIAATMINQIGNMAFVFIVLYIQQHLGYTISQGALAFAMISMSMLVGGLIAGNLIDYFGATRMMITAIILNGIVLLIFPFLRNYTFIVGLCFFWGLFYGVYRPASQTLISQLTDDGIHKISFSVYRLAVNLGMSIGPALAGYLATHSFPAIFIANGATNILAGIILIRCLSSNAWQIHHLPAENKRVLSIKWLKHDRTLLLFLLGMIPVSMVFFQHETTLAVYLKQDLGLPLSFYGWLFTINTLMIVFFELSLNVAMLHWPYRVNFILGALLIGGGFAGMLFAHTQWHIVILTVIWTIGEMILYPSASSYIAEIAPASYRGSYMSLFSASSNLGMLLGPWAGSIIMQEFGTVPLWITCAIWGLLSVGIFSLLKEPAKKLQAAT